MHAFLDNDEGESNMKCKFCGAELLEGDKFCTACGKKVEWEEEQKPEWIFCTQCGTKLAADSKFCTGCGAKVESSISSPVVITQEEQTTSVVEKPEVRIETSENMKKENEEQQESKEFAEKIGDQHPQKESKQEPVKEEFLPQNDRLELADNKPETSDSNKKTIALVVVIVVVAVVLIIGAILLYKRSKPTPVTVEDDQWKTENDFAQESTEVVSSEDIVEEESTEVDLSTVDYDVTIDNEVTLDGVIVETADSGKVIAFDAPKIFYGSDETGENVLVDNVRTVVLDSQNLPDDMLFRIENNTAAKVSGKIAIYAGKVFIQVDAMQDMYGNDMIAMYGSVQDDDYILPDSSDVYLTEEDIEDLSLQEINYAKNEIYARHGRKFDSVELQEYFESKSWYNGTIDPADFKDSDLSKIERANVKLLKDREFSIDPKGYKLD